MTTQIRNPDMVNLLRADFQARYEPQFALAQVMSHMAALPALRGFWPMSAVASGGNAFDQSGNGRTLTYNGNPVYNFTGLAPYINFDGTGDYLSRADESGLDILGTESYIGTPGLTLGGWFYFDAGGSTETTMSKWSLAAGQRSYQLQKLSTNVTRLLISGDGSAAPTVAHTDALSAAAWHFLVGRFTPSTELAAFADGVKATNTSSIPASIFNSTTAFQVSGQGGANILMTGRASLCFLCAAALSDAIIGNLYQSSRPLFGV